MHKIFEFNEFRLETTERRLQRNGTAVPLAPKVFDTLVMLLENPGRLLSKDELMQKVWPNTFVEEVSLAQNISQLRKALGDTAAGPQIIQTVAKQGYRFVAPVRIVSSDVSSDAARTPRIAAIDRSVTNNTPNLAAVPDRATWQLVASLVAVLIVGGLGYSTFASRRDVKIVAPPPIRSIAVLPLANLSTDPEQEFFVDGMTDDLITELARIHALRVISRTSVMQYKGTRKPLPEIARELNVDALVEGTVSQRNGHLHITAQLVQANPEQHIWAESYERPLEEAQNIQSEIAREIAAALQTTMTAEEQARMRRSRATNAEANLLYLKGRYFWNKRTAEGVRQGAQYFEEAVAKDADFAQAYVGLADAYIFEGGWGMEPATVALPRAEAAARRAIALASDNAEAHAALGLIAMNYEWDWPKAEREYKVALALNPNDSTAHHWYGEYLGAQGRFDEGLAELSRAQDLDPLSLAIASDRGKLLYFSRRYDEALAQLQKALEMDPDFQQAHFWLARVYAEKRMMPELDAELEKLRADAGDSANYWALASVAKSKTGKLDEARVAGAKAKARSGTSPDAANMLYVQIALGNADGSFAWLEKCYATHSTIMTSLKVNPDYDRLRSDPRFAKYLQQVGLAD